MTDNNENQTLSDALQAIAELQTKVAFQEHTIDELNDALTGQQYQIEKLQVQTRHLLDKLKAMAPSDVARLSEETPPPHY